MTVKRSGSEAKWLFSVIAAIFVLAAPAAALAQAPSFVPLAGQLLDSDDQPVEGEVAFTLRLYDSDAGGDLLYEEELMVDVEAGVFRTQIGQNGELEAALFRDHSHIYIGVTVGDDSEMTPRTRLGSAPYALSAEYAHSAGDLDGLGADDFRQSAEMIPFDDILDPPESHDTLAELDCAQGEIPMWSGTDWSCDVGWSFDPTLESVTSEDIGTWDAAYGWDDHSEAGYLTQESDPLFEASAAYGIASSDISGWNAAYGWGDHSEAGYLTEESDPVFEASPAYAITDSYIDNWTDAYMWASEAYDWGDHSTAGYLTQESDPSVGANSTDYVPRWTGSSLDSGSIYDDGDRVGVATGGTPDALFQVGEVETFSSSTLDAHLDDYNQGVRGQDQWQIFRPETSGSLEQISVHNLGCSTRSGTLSIYSGEGVGSSPLLEQSFTTPYVCDEWIDFALNSTVPVQAGERLTFRLQTSMDFNLRGNTEGAYPDGYYHSDVFGTQTDWGVNFRTYVVPSPTAPSLMVSDDGRVGMNVDTPQRSAHIGDVMRLEPQYVAPPDPQAGDLYFDKELGVLRYHDGTDWVDL